MPTSEPEEFQLKLEGIETQWSLVRQAHDTPTPTSGSDIETARKSLVLRYSTAIRKFVAAIVRDPIDADEVSQELVLKLMRGDFAGADPDRGRFRDFLKTATRNAIKNYWSARSRRRETDIAQGPDPESVASDQLDEIWTQSCRNNILQISWSRLEKFEQKIPGNASYRLLKLRTDHPDWSIEQISKQLSSELGREVASNTVRQQLRRARLRFAEFVVEEVAHGLQECAPHRIQDELISLGLFEYIKDALPAEFRID